MTASFAALRAAALRLAGALVIPALLAACSGAVSNQVVDPDRLTILPGTATVYSSMPTTFALSGGTGQYIVSSSDQAVIPSTGDITSAHSIVIIANPVLADRVVTLTVRDTGDTPAATATITVKPNGVNNNITITPSGTQGGSCAPAVCSGGDAEVRANVSVAGVPLPGHTVRLQVVSGDFRFITTTPGSPIEVLSTSVDVISDQLGGVSARIRVLPDAPNQTALLQVTDLDSGAFQRSSFLIAQSTGTSPGFFVTPTSVTFSGRFTGQCATTGDAVFYVFGGSPPYTVLNTAPSAFTLSDSTVFNSGDGFFIRVRGPCVTDAAFIVRDSAGRTVTVTASNVEGTTTPTPVAVAPDEVTLTSCFDAASVTIAGGTGGPYFVSVGNNSLFASVTASTVTIRRKQNPSSPAVPGTTPLSVGVSDGRTTATVTVNVDPLLAC